MYRLFYNAGYVKGTEDYKLKVGEKYYTIEFLKDKNDTDLYDWMMFVDIEEVFPIGFMIDAIETVEMFYGLSGEHKKGLRLHIYNEETDGRAFVEFKVID